MRIVIATQAAGSRQQSRFLALMSDSNRLTELTTEAWDSAGASEKQFGKTQESLKTKLQDLKNAWDEFTTKILDSDFIKTLIDAGTKILTLINDITGNSGLARIAVLLGAFRGLGAVLTPVINGLGKMVTIGDHAAIQVVQWESLFTTLKKGVPKLKEGTNWFRGFIQTTKSGVNEFRYIQSITGELDELGANWGKAGIKGAAFGEKLMSLTGATTALGASLAIIIPIVAALGVAFIAYNNSYKGLVKQAQKARDAADEEKEKLQELESEVESIDDKIAELKAQGPLELSDQADLERLKAESAELREQISLQKVKEQQANDKANKKGVAAMQAYLNGYSDTVTETIQTNEGAGTKVRVERERTNQEKIAELEKMQEAIDQVDYSTLTKEQQEYYESYIKLQQQLGVEAGAFDLFDVVDRLNEIGVSDFDTSLWADKVLNKEEIDDAVTQCEEQLRDSMSEADWEQIFGGLNDEQIKEALQSHFEEAAQKALEEGIGKQNIQLDITSSIADLDAIEDNLKPLTDALKELEENGNISNNTLLNIVDTMTEAGVAAEDTEAAMKKITDGDVQGGINDLANAYLNSKGVLEGLNDTTRNYYITQLQSLGVTNAEEAVTQQLIVVKYQAVQAELAELNAKTELTVAEQQHIVELNNEIASLNYEAEAAGVSSAQLYVLAAAEAYAASGNFAEVMSSYGNSILDVGEAAGLSTKNLSKYMQALDNLDKARKALEINLASGNPDKAYYDRYQNARDALIKNETEAITEFDKIANRQINFSYNYTPPSTSSSTGKTPSSGSGSGSGKTKSSLSGNDYDWDYNLLKEISSEQEKINTLEEKLNKLVEKGTSTYDARLKNLNEQESSLKNIIKLNKEERRKWLYKNKENPNYLRGKSNERQYVNNKSQGRDYGKNSTIKYETSDGKTASFKKDLTRYVWYDQATNSSQINYDLVKKLQNSTSPKDAALLERIKEAQAYYDSIASTISDTNQNITEANDQLNEIKESRKEYQKEVLQHLADLEIDLFDALVENSAKKYSERANKARELNEGTWNIKVPKDLTESKTITAERTTRRLGRDGLGNSDHGIVTNGKADNSKIKSGITGLTNTIYQLGALNRDSNGNILLNDGYNNQIAQLEKSLMAKSYTYNGQKLKLDKKSKTQQAAADIEALQRDISGGVEWDKKSKTYKWVDGLDQQIEVQQKAIEALNKNSDAIYSATSELINAMREDIQERRQARENQKSEESITDKQKRLAYLQMDTTGGNAVEIKRLQEELEDESQQLTDKFVDQKIDELEKQNDESRKLQEKSIQIEQNQLEVLQADKEAKEEQIQELEHEYIEPVKFVIEDLKLRAEAIEEYASEQDAAADAITTAAKEDQTFRKNLFTAIDALIDASGSKTASDKKTAKNTMKSILNTYEGNNDTGRYSGEVGTDDVKDKVNQGSGAASSIFGKAEAGKKVSSLTEGERDLLKGSNVLDQNGKKIGTITKVTENKKTGAVKYTYKSGNDTFTFTPSEANLVANKNGTVSAKITKYNVSDLLSNNKSDLLNKKVIRDGKSLGTVRKVTNSGYYYGKNGDNLYFRSTGTYDYSTGKITVGKNSKGKYVKFRTSGGGDVNAFLPVNSTEKFIKYKTSKAYYKYSWDGLNWDKNLLKKKNKTINGDKFGNKKEYNEYATGGLASYTGPAWLDGTPSKPELVLNARDTENFIQLKDVLSKFMSNGTTNTNTSSNLEFTINVQQLSSDYDVDKLANKIKKIIAKDGSYRNVHQISTVR